MGSRSITLMSGLIMMVLTLVSGFSIYVIMRHEAEDLLTQSLSLSLETDASRFVAAVKQQSRSLQVIASRPFIIQELRKLNADDTDHEARFFLQRAARSFRDTGLSAIAILNQSGKTIAASGTFVKDTSQGLSLKLPGSSRLLYDQRLTFSSEVPIHFKGAVIGSVRAQARMPSLEKMLYQSKRLGHSGELAICEKSGETHINCLPTRLHTQFFRVPNTIYGVPLPMMHALSGETGVVLAKDYRQKDVVAAFMPLDDTGLGMVLKVDSSELFEPFKRDLTFILPTLGILVLLGMLATRLLLTPIIHRIVRSERATKHAHAQLADREARLRVFLDNISDGIVIIDTKGIIESINPSLLDMFGYSSDELLGQNVSMLMPEPMRSHHDEYIRHYLETGENKVVGLVREVTAVKKNGKTFPIDLRVVQVRLEDGIRFVGTIRDISEHKRDLERIAFQATHDPLTRLPNRNLLRDRVEQAIAMAKRHPHAKVAILFVDLDYFKAVNDQHGHEVGDHLLVAVANRIRAVIRSEDTAARLGGDEFIVALPNLSGADGAATVAKKLLDSLSEPYLIQGHELRISASIGLSLYPDDGTNMETLLKRSDDAMYSAKMAGRGVYRHR